MANWNLPVEFNMLLTTGTQHVNHCVYSRWIRVDTGLTLKKISIWTRTDSNERGVRKPPASVVCHQYFFQMGMSLQKKFICGFTSFVLFIGLVGFIIGFFARSSKNCGGAKKSGNNDRVGMITLQKDALEQVAAQRIRDYQKWVSFSNDHINKHKNSSVWWFIHSTF